MLGLTARLVLCVFDNVLEEEDTRAADDRGVNDIIVEDEEHNVGDKMCVVDDIGSVFDTEDNDERD